MQWKWRGVAAMLLLFLAGLPGAERASAQFATSSPLNADVWNSGNPVALGSSTTMTLVFVAQAPYSPDSLMTDPAVLTQGATGKDFTLVSNSCGVNNPFNAGSICTETVSFAPKAAGLRMGAITFNTSFGYQTFFLYGVGSGPQLAYGPPQEIALDPAGIAGNSTKSFGVVVDGAGDLYVSDAVNNRVVEVPASGGSTIVISPNVGGLGLSSPQGLAVDGAGNLFIADRLRNRVVEVPSTPGAAAFAIAPTVNSLGLHSPIGVAVDGQGDLYIADSQNNRVVEVNAGSSTGIAIAPAVDNVDLNQPNGLAVDAAGNLLIADLMNNRIVEVPATGGVSAATAVNGGGIVFPTGVAVDGAGNAFVASFLGGLTEIPGNGGAAFVVNPAEALNVALDSYGDLYTLDGSNNLTEQKLQTAVALSFPTATTDGNTDTTDGTQIVQVLNIGNGPLRFSGVSYPADFSQGQDGNTQCASVAVLALGEQCDVAVQFTPVYPAGGALNESVRLTDNAAFSPQSIALTGTAIQLPATHFSVSAPNGTSPGQSISVTVKALLVNGNTATAYTGTVKFSSSDGAAVLPANSTLTHGIGTFTVKLNTLGTQTVTATDTVSTSVTGTSSAIHVVSSPPAVLTSPTPGTTLPGPKVTFSWSSSSTATSYVLKLGTSVGGNNLYGSGNITATSVMTVNLPANGGTIYARLYTVYGSVSVYSDYTFAAATKAALTSPGPDTVLTGPKVAFSWNPATGANFTGYILRIGTTAGGSDVYGSGPTTALSVTPANLPTNGETLYGRLTTIYGSVSVYSDYIFTAATKAALSSPAPSTTLAGPKVTFSWSPAVGASFTQYFLRIGTTTGGGDVYASPGTTATSLTPANLPTNGEALHARLITVYGSTSVYSDYTFTAAARAVLTSPAPGTTLAGPKVTFSWSPASGANLTQYILRIGTTIGGSDVYGSGATTATSATPAINLPTNGETLHVRLFTVYGSISVYNDYVFTASAKASLTSPAPSTTLTGPKMTFSWSPASGASLTQYILQIGTTVGGHNIYGSGGITATSITPAINLPTNGETLYVRLVSVYGSVSVFNDYTFTAATKAALLSPKPGTLSGSTVTFSWSAAPGSTGYALRLGTTAGANDLYNSGTITATSATPTNLPTNGVTIYARLITVYGSVLVYNDYVFTAGP